MYKKIISLNKLLLVIISLASVSLFSQQESNGKYADVNGMKMYYEVSGEGDPLIVLTGAHMDIMSMGKFIPMLSETHKVYALEFQGHGHTEDIDRPITYENLADDVDRLYGCSRTK
jgi:hypothetical protein